MKRRTSKPIVVERIPKVLLTVPQKVAVLEEQVKGVAEVRADVKTILSSVNEIKISIAERPTFADCQKMIAPVAAQVGELEKIKTEAKGAWKVATVASTVVGGVITAGYYLVTTLKDLALNHSAMTHIK